MKTSQPLISVITVNYNQSSVTCKLIESLKSEVYLNKEVIVIDNNSPNDNPHIIKQRYPDIILILNKKNGGFAAGNNIGIKKAKGEYVILLNNDTEVPNDFFSHLVKRMEANSSIGAISPKIRYYDKPKILQYAGYTRMNKLTMRNRAIGYNEIDIMQYDQGFYTHYTHGAAMMVSREAIEKVGLMTEDYFLYYEELDWCERIKKQHFKIAFEPHSIVFHKESISTGKNSPLKTYYQTRNRLMYAKRNHTAISFVSFFIYRLFFVIPKDIFLFLFQSDIPNLKAYVRAIFGIKFSNN